MTFPNQKCGCELIMLLGHRPGCPINQIEMYRQQAEQTEELLRNNQVITAELQKLLNEAILLAEEGWAYAPDYVRDKHSCSEQISTLRKMETEIKKKLIKFNE